MIKGRRWKATLPQEPRYAMKLAGLTRRAAWVARLHSSDVWRRMATGT
jgi:hypothetical protein